MDAKTAVAMLAVGMVADEPVLYKPLSKLGGAATFTASPQRVLTLASGEDLLDDDDISLTDDDDVILTDG